MRRHKQNKNDTNGTFNVWHICANVHSIQFFVVFLLFHSQWMCHHYILANENSIWFNQKHTNGINVMAKEMKSINTYFIYYINDKLRCFQGYQHRKLMLPSLVDFNNAKSLIRNKIFDRKKNRHIFFLKDDFMLRSSLYSMSTQRA